MRRCILAAPKVGIVNFPGDAYYTYLQGILSDRIANGEAFPNERVVRLPRHIKRGFNSRTGRYELHTSYNI